MKQTSVEWLFEQLCSEKLSWNKDSNGKLFIDRITSDIFQQAKKMEKEQIISAHIKGLLSKDITSICNEDIRAEQYYNETYKSE
jgi:hypothetical protein